MIERVKNRFDLQPRRLAGDTVYGAVRLLKWLVDRNITPHIPVWDKSARSDGTFSRADFVFDRSRNIYICPNGKLLHTTGTVIDGSTLRYRASKLDCDICTFKMQCCPHTPARHEFSRDLHEDARDVARALAKTEAFEQSRRERKKVEMRFAHMKRILKLDRLRLRGLNGAKDEVLLTATAQNLRRLVQFLTAAHRQRRQSPVRPSPAASSGYRDHHNKLTNTQISSAAKSSRVLQHNPLKAIAAPHRLRDGCSTSGVNARGRDACCRTSSPASGIASPPHRRGRRGRAICRVDAPSPPGRDRSRCPGPVRRRAPLFRL